MTKMPLCYPFVRAGHIYNNNDNNDNNNNDNNNNNNNKKKKNEVRELA